jgi:hypothetical protein
MKCLAAQTAAEGEVEMGDAEVDTSLQINSGRRVKARQEAK